MELLFNGTRDQIIDKAGNLIKTKAISTILREFSYIDPDEKKNVGTASQSSIISLLIGLLTAALLTLLLYSYIYITYDSNTPLEGMWGIVNILQVTSYLTLIDLSYPENLVQFLSYLEIVHNYSSFIPNLFEYIIQKEDIQNNPFSPTFESRNISNRNILLLCGSDIEIIILIYICLSILNCFKLKHRTIWNLNRKFRFNALIRTFVVAYLKFALASFLNIGVVIYKYIYIYI